MTKETSQISLQTLWHLRKPQINLVSLRRDSFTDVGYTVISVKLQRFSVVLIDIIVNFELVDGGNLIRMSYSETGLGYLIIKLVIVYL